MDGRALARPSVQPRVPEHATGSAGGHVDWEDRLDAWELELDLAAQLEGSDWVTLERAAADTGASRAALRNWYRTGQIPSRLVDGPHGPQRLVPLALVAARAETSPRLRRTAERRLADEAQTEILRHRIDQLELRLAALERRQRPDTGPAEEAG
jgi:transposase